jgi:hypothetical protein
VKRKLSCAPPVSSGVRGWFLIPCVGFPLLGACGSSDTDPSNVAPVCEATPYDSGIPDVPVVPPMDEATFVSTYVKTFCDALESCCAAGNVGFGRAACEADATSELDALKDDTYVPEGGALCIGAVTWFGQVCPTMGLLSALAVTFGCNAAYNGTSPAGGSCNNATDCAAPPGGGVLCAPLDGTQIGSPKVCQTTVVDRGAGEKCTRLIEDVAEIHSCVDGYDCDEDRGICVADCDGGLGEPCGSCQAGLHCAGGVCVKSKYAGESCSNDIECFGSCESGVCRLGLTPAICYSPPG